MVRDWPRPPLAAHGVNERRAVLPLRAGVETPVVILAAAKIDVASLDQAAEVVLGLQDVAAGADVVDGPRRIGANRARLPPVHGNRDLAAAAVDDDDVALRVEETLPASGARERDEASAHDEGETGQPHEISVDPGGKICKRPWRVAAHI